MHYAALYWPVVDRPVQYLQYIGQEGSFSLHHFRRVKLPTEIYIYVLKNGDFLEKKIEKVAGSHFLLSEILLGKLYLRKSF